MASRFDVAHQIGKPWALPCQIEAGDRSFDTASTFAIEHAGILRTAPMFGTSVEVCGRRR